MQDRPFEIECGFHRTGPPPESDCQTQDHHHEIRLPTAYDKGYCRSPSRGRTHCPDDSTLPTASSHLQWAARCGSSRRSPTSTAHYWHREAQ